MIDDRLIHLFADNPNTHSFDSHVIIDETIFLKL